MEPGTRAYGVPYPGTFMLDGSGRVTARYFEAAYQERNTVAGHPEQAGRRAGAGPWPPCARRTSRCRRPPATRSSRPGSRFSLSIEVTPRRGMHVYAPGKHDYQVVRFIARQPAVAAQCAADLSAVGDLPLRAARRARVETYLKPFTLVQDLTILATPEAQKLLAGQKSLTVSGTLEYQACDDKICYAPAKVPLSFALELTPLLRPGQ